MDRLGPDVMALLGEIAREERLMLTITAHAFNPEGMRGADAIGAEIAAQGRATHVYVPTGGGGLLVATARGLRDAGSAAALVAAQPEGCAPISLALSGRIDVPAITEWSTKISGLQLPEPPDGVDAVAAVERSGGWGATVPDEDAWAAQDLLARAEGVFVEPASAVALAAVRSDAEAGRLGRDDEPCVLLTGSGLKDLGRYSAPAHRPIPATPDDVARRVSSWLRDQPAGTGGSR
jgi:threonine synthase